MELEERTYKIDEKRSVFMASITGTRSSTSASSIRGYSGLASGLDRDSLIESMTLGTKTKIANQKKSKQLLQWKQDAYRSISSKMIAFGNKYTSYSSSTNLLSPSFFSRTSITASGANSKYVDVTGAINGSSSVSILGVKQLASDASVTSKTVVSDQKVTSGEISTDITATQTVSNIEGQSIGLKYGNTTVRLALLSGTSSDGFTYDYSTMDKAIASINKSMESVEISGNKKLSDVLKVEANGSAGISFVSKDTAGNTLALTGGSGNVLQHLGILNEGETIGTLDSSRTEITSDGLKSVKDAVLTHQETFAERIAGKTIAFSYNGTIAKIQLPEADKITSLDDVVNSLQKSLDSVFGTGRVKVGLDDKGSGMSSFTFKTTQPNGSADSSSVFSVAYADYGVLGKNGAFGMVEGESNRLNMSASLSEAGLSRYSSSLDPSADLDLTINGVKLEGLTNSSTLKEIMDKINNTEGVNVSVSYLSNADKFVIKSTEAGAGGQVKLEGAGAALLFGTKGTDYEVTKGQDAIVSVQYAGSDEVMDVVRGSNSFKLDGLNISVKSEFGYDKTENPDGSITYTEKAGNEKVEFTAKVDSDKVVNAIKDMVKDFNEMLALVNTEVSTKPNRKYPPLTDEQKEEMTDEQIKTWEEKAKAGMLFNDSTIRGITDDFRFLISVGTEDKSVLESIGISVSTSYSDNGKLVIDETKLKAALDSDPEKVMDVFTRAADDTTGDTGGIMAKMTKTLDKYAKTTGATKGILIERAGSTSVPTSVLKNSILTQMNSIDKTVERLQSQLTTETDRYIKKFTSLETLISQMNSQSSWLSSI